MLDSPPTTSPTGVGGLDIYYPDYDTAWSVATCKNKRPLPFLPGGRPVYDTMLECCKGACKSCPRRGAECLDCTFECLMLWQTVLSSLRSRRGPDQRSVPRRPPLASHVVPHQIRGT